MRGSVIIRYIWSTTMNVGYCPRVNGPLAWSVPVDGGYGPWNAWSSCSKTCGGVQSRSRLCNHPDGLPCVGPSRETLDCNLKMCPSNYIAQYPVLRTAQSALYFTSLTDLFTQTPSRLLWEAYSHMLQLMRDGCSYTYPPLSIARYS